MAFPDVLAEPPAAPAPPASPDAEPSSPNILNDHGVLLFALVVYAIGLMAARLSWRRHTRRRDAAQQVHAEADQKNAQAEEARLKKLTVLLEELPRLVPAEAAKVCSDCPICLSPFNECDEVASQLPCKHVFHSECIERWVLSRPHTPQRGGSSCPYCKSFLLKEDFEVAAVTVEVATISSTEGLTVVEGENIPAAAELPIVPTIEADLREESFSTTASSSHGEQGSISTTAPPSPSPSPPARSPLLDLFA